MTARRVSLWVTCGMVSVLLHGGALLGLGLSVEPAPAPPQASPKSKLNIESQHVNRTQAEQTPASGDEAKQEIAPAARATQGAIPQSKAKPSSITPPTLPPAKPHAVAVPSTSVIGATAASAVSVTQTPAVPLPASAPKAKPARIAAQKATIAAIDGSVIVSSVNTGPKTGPVAQPGLSLSQTPPPTQTAAPLGAKGNALDLATPSQNPSTALALPAQKGTASLAWSGDQNSSVDPLSLAAIQAFMQPGDLSNSASSAGELRDGIAAVLASVPCARLQTTFIPETGALELRGHIPEGALRAPVLAALKQHIGTAIPITDELLILPRPQCGALAGIANIGLPQSTDQLTNPRVIGPDGFARNITYYGGQKLTLDLTTPDYDSFVYVDFFAADGTVIHLQPNAIVPLEFQTAKSQMTIGKSSNGEPSLDITISPPFGQEIAAAFAASVPLYQEERPIQEPAEPYLDFLRTRVAKARADDPDFKGEWVYFFVSTKAR